MPDDSILKLGLSDNTVSASAEIEGAIITSKNSNFILFAKLASNSLLIATMPPNALIESV